MNKFIGIIPARYASTRFPGKPLADIGGKTMIEHVYRRASSVLDRVIVATDDNRIADAVKAFGGEVILTSPDHPSGTDRVREAYILSASDADVIINIQGDEPFIEPKQIELLMKCFDDPTTDIATLAREFDASKSFDELANPNLVKVCMGVKSDALYFSRSVIPYVRGCSTDQWLKQATFHTHIGIYAYRSEVLKEITQLERTPLEIAESLEQLRWLENGYKINVAITDCQTIGIDTPDDLEKARQYFKDLNDIPQQHFRTTPPEIRDFAWLELPEITSSELSNGVIIDEINIGKGKANYLIIGWEYGFGVPSAGYASRLVPKMLMQGTRNLSAQSIVDRVDYLGSFIDNNVSAAYTELKLLSLNDFTGELLTLMSDILLNPTFPEERFEAIKRKELAQYDLLRTRTSHRAFDELIRLLVGDKHPYLLPVDRSAITEASVDEVRKAWNNGFNLSRLRIICSGDISESLHNHIATFGNILRSQRTTASSTVPHEMMPEKAGRHFIEIEKANQSSIAIGIPTINRSHEDYVALRIAIVALGGYFGSRLMTNIREEKGLTYGINASLIGSREGSYILITADCDTSYVDTVIDEIKAEIYRLSTVPMGVSEFKRLRSYYMTYLASTIDNFKNIGSYYATTIFNNFPQNYFERQQAVFSRITPEDIMLIAARYISFENAAIVIAGPNNKR